LNKINVLYDHENSLLTLDMDKNMPIYNKNGERIETIKDKSVMRYIITLNGYIVKENTNWKIIKCQESNRIIHRDFEWFPLDGNNVS
jgi:hypothetical protein